MGNNKCCALSCNHSKKNSPHLSFHRIPKDRSEEWVKRLGNPKLSGKSPDQLYNSYVVCSDHLPRDAFNSQRFPSLKHNTLPTISTTDTGVVLEIGTSEDASDIDDPQRMLLETQTSTDEAIGDSTSTLDTPGSIDTQSAGADQSAGTPNMENSSETIGGALQVIMSTSITDSALSGATNGSASTSWSGDHNYVEMDCSAGAQSAGTPNMENLTETIGGALQVIMSSSITDSALSGATNGSASTSWSGDHNYVEMDCSEAGRHTPEISESGPAATSTPAKKKVFRRGVNRKMELPEIPYVPKKNRTPMEAHLLECAAALKKEALKQRANYLKKCEEVRVLKSSNNDWDAVESLRDKVNPRFFKFLEAEVRNFRRKPQSRRWSKDILADFESMRKRGPRSFRGLPFTKPTRKTMQGVLKKIELQPGINKGIFEMLENKLAAMTDEDRVCVVMFDEMSLKVFLSYLEQDDDIKGHVDLGALGKRPDLAEEVLVAMIRSVFGTWKLPLAFWFTCKKLNADDFSCLFETTIRALLDVGADVRVIVTDGLQKNIAAERMLGATYEEPWITINEKRIVTVCDPPHLMKSMRNAVVTYLLHQADGTLVDVGFIKAFLLQDVEQFPRLAPKVTLRHTQPNSFEKMNVGMAVRLFGPDVSSGMQTHIITGSLPPEAAATAKFSEELYTFFQSFQGINYIEEPGNMNFSCAFTDKSSHKEFWLKMIKKMEGWTFLGGDRVQVIKNWTMTVVAFLELWRGLKESGFSNMPVGHINQDPEENLFSGYRFNGGHRSNPTVQDFPSTFLRSFVKFLTSESKGKNCRDDEAVNLFDLEELMAVLENATPEPPTLPTHFDVEEEEEFWEESESEVDELSTIASAKAVAPILSSHLKKLQCEECKVALVTLPEFPLHLPHTMSAAPGEMDTLLPNRQLAHVARKIYKAVLYLKGRLWELPKNKAVETLYQALLRLIPDIENVLMCENHKEEKDSLMKSLIKKALQDLFLKLNQEFKDRKKKTTEAAPGVSAGAADVDPDPGPSTAPKPSKKYQRVAHL